MSLNLVLNAVSAAVVSLVILFGSHREYMRLFFILYAILLVILLVMKDGGQVNAALALVAALSELLAWMNPGYAFTNKPGSNEGVRVFKGIANLSVQRSLVYNTFDPSSSRYVRLPQSINRTGGAQFSYRFWLKIGSSKKDTDLENKTLFLRGDMNRYGMLPETTCDYRMKDPSVAGYLTLCPRVYFKSTSELAVAFNTDRKLLQEVVFGNREKSAAATNNMLSLLYGKFAMLTVTIEDNVDITEFERGIRVSLYVNDSLYSIKTVSGSLRVNDGNIVIAPEDTIGQTLTDVYLADLTYYNYALSDLEVRALYMLGHSNSTMSETMAGTGELVLSPYNPIDRYNTDANTLVR